ncbi:MAG: hypothetical protein GF401_14685 [Chitinivibrionales bacterium]|nr:hypothetical protein [Chitinivibrionales bacterium]
MSDFMSVSERHHDHSNPPELPANFSKASSLWTAKTLPVWTDMTTKPQECHPLFRTVVPVTSCCKKIDLSHTVFSTGSCFATHIGAMLAEYHASLCMHPTGILYNPASICAMINRVLNHKGYSENELFEYNGLWRSFDHHTQFSAKNKDECLQSINREFDSAIQSLTNADFCIVTFGTAFVYKLCNEKKVVANCHTLPHDHFDRMLLSPGEITEMCSRTFDSLLKHRPDIQLIITISPVRHLRDSVHENCISKSHLFAALHTLEKRYEKLYYFPSYEIMMDELRDYRFYAADMVHPSETAVEYIRSRFQQACMSERFGRFIQSFKPVLQAMKHKIKTTSSDAVSRFAQGQLATLDRLEKEYKEIDLSKEKEYFSSLWQH